MQDTISNYLGSDKDMAHHPFDAYEVNDEIHIHYKNGHVATELIEKVRENKDAYLYTPYVMFIHKCGYNNSTKKGEA